jgi:hypothetical protein
MTESGLDVDGRRDLIEPLMAAGAPFRALAEEQMALVDIEAGDKEAAVTRLRSLLEDQDASGALRRRVSQLIMALGESLDTNTDAS